MFPSLKNGGPIEAMLTPSRTAFCFIMFPSLKGDGLREESARRWQRQPRCCASLNSGGPNEVCVLVWDTELTEGTDFRA